MEQEIQDLSVFLIKKLQDDLNLSAIYSEVSGNASYHVITLKIYDFNMYISISYNKDEIVVVANAKTVYVRILYILKKGNIRLVHHFDIIYTIIYNLYTDINVLSILTA